MEKQLYRSREKRIVSGVLGGLGEYLGVDPNVLRLVWVFITIFSGLIPGIVVYLLAIVLIPLAPEHPRSIQARVIEMGGRR
ncbi:hypothetical protein COU17_01375 [Candidatus Kaiserbacteria bacterium CG10_big_fil_rev_8_21_14_0_10_49_17]|uniref:Phage shock protein PspC N-terminal domain-containing protein n=1 Tax=Candidatus Kaiserbacteria bacterium CG10_big_fil_rev_8_21_14_0_10_49_17 TaxID=1974609 RepID=A0A2M6WEN3_9BACT|nr:MAG: hypothetical protein COU17_01375 [Candidatus Kaiserbacteria bacterium CG10_big_fil_rev_8_21_14_0_10_49_17]